MRSDSSPFRRLAGLAALPVLVLAASSCGSDPSSPASGASASSSSGPGGFVPPDPCELLTSDQIATVLGEPAPTGILSIEATPPINLRQCDWSTGGADFSSRTIFLSIATSAGLAAGGAGGDGYTAADLFADTLQIHTSAIDVEGLGDRAFFTGADMQELHVLQGDHDLTISALTLGSAAQPINGDQLRTLLADVVAEL